MQKKKSRGGGQLEEEGVQGGCEQTIEVIVNAI